ncbi:DUF742 domain-containing protein [Streptosporangium carneum]|uniref:DUF742 domain-containing protein n=1 Tax=Streptosporangium carneum TaxID=47481 RepID=A0A9W6HZ02_9ACTN|nr:DUF742 domain-containing protein [Streptosporangium carneum]GLK07955.1 hypothetical protein GCM10017600_13600 [Streptosporangium carneum]
MLGSDGSGDEEPLFRPYTVTGGRAEPRYHMAIETLVSSSFIMDEELALLTPEQEAIIRMCRAFRSVAEISALLRVPLGVARVLVADMADEGLVRLHQPSLDKGQPDLTMLERVLSGLRRL